MAETEFSYPDNYEHITVVYNPVSARASQVNEFIDTMRAQCKSRKLGFDAVATPSADRAQSIPHIQASLRPYSRIIGAGGDGLDQWLANAVLGHPDQDDSLADSVTIGFAPFGGYNDHASVFTHSRHPAHFLASRATTITEMTPMEVAVNGEHLWYSPLYTSVGWTAHAAKKFSDSEIRGTMRRLPPRLKQVYGNAMLAAYFLETGFNSTLTVEHDGQTLTEVGDIFALNSPVAGSVVRTNEAWHRDPERFLASFIDAGLSARSAYFGRALVNSILGPVRTAQLAGNPTSELTLGFNGDPLMLQSEGEVHIDEVEKVTIRKSDQCLRVVDSRRHMSPSPTTGSET